MNEYEEIRNYCLNCITKPCKEKGCPLQNDIPAFIHENDIKKAFEKLCSTTVLPAICGRICPHSQQCQGSCVRGIKGEPVSIGKMESMIGDMSLKEEWPIQKEVEERLTSKKVAIIGGGPAGLTCAAFLARKGVQVTIFEKNEKLGGILSYGIPDFRLEPTIVEETINKILALGIEAKTNFEIGENIKLEDLQKEYDAIFIAIGANVGQSPRIEGAEFKGVYSANAFLENKRHSSYKGKNVAVIGGGNVAIDTARTMKKLGAEKVVVIYRRPENQMPASKEEIKDAKEDNVEFLFKTNIVKILSDDKENVSKIECIKTKSESRNQSPKNIEGSNFVLDIDYVLFATGARPDKEIVSKFEQNEKGYILVNEDMQTSIPNVYAGGDVAGERATVAWAARSGRNAANKILENLTQD